MRSDDELTLSASIDWFDESSFAADAVHSCILESMDCGALLGDVWSHGTGYRGPC
jgi:hypothetical protein